MAKFKISITVTGIVAKSSSAIDTVTVTLGTLVAVLLMSNALLFVFGCVCGHYLSNKLANRDTRPSQLQPAPVYENLQLKTTTVDEQEVELEKNVAYGHFQRTQENIQSGFGNDVDI